MSGTTQPSTSGGVWTVALTPFYTEGGCSARILGELEGPRGLGVHPGIFAYRSGRDPSGWTVERPPGAVKRMGVGFQSGRPRRDLELLRTVLRDRTYPALVHAHLHEGGAIGASLLKLRGVPSVLDLQGSMSEEVAQALPAASTGWTQRTLSRVERLVERTAAQVVVSSPGLLSSLRQDGRVDPARVHLLQDGMNPALFPSTDAARTAVRTAWRRAHGVPEEDVLVGYVGVFAPSQGIDGLLRQVPRMLERAPRLRFFLFGTGSAGSSIAEYRRKSTQPEMKGRVSIPGPLPFPEVPDFLVACDIGVTWKLLPTEGNGKMPLYMAAGLPTVAMAGPVSEGYLGPHGEIGGLLAGTEEGASQAVIDLAHDPSLRTRLGQRARETAVRELDWVGVARRLAEIYALATEGRFALGAEDRPRSSM